MTPNKNKNLPLSLVTAAQAGDRKAREDLVKGMEGLVHRAARQFTEGSTIPAEDLRQECWVAILESLQTFDPQHGTSFETYCWGPMRRTMAAAMPNYLAGPSIPSRTMDRYWEVMKAAQGDVSVALEIASSMDMKTGTFAMVHQAVSGTWSIHAGFSTEEEAPVDGGYTPNTLGAAGDVPTMDSFEELASSMEAEAYLAVLTDPREVGVLKMALGFNGKDPMTHAEIGKAIGVSRQMVDKISTRALVKIREAIVEGN